MPKELPKPLFVARVGNESDMELLKKAIGRDVLEAAYGPGGGGYAEILGNLWEANIKQREADKQGDEPKEAE